VADSRFQNAYILQAAFSKEFGNGLRALSDRSGIESGKADAWDADEVFEVV
jgi:hypothetical protein